MTNRSGVGLTSRTSASQSSSTRRGDVQGLRAVAVLAVVVYHADLPLPGGFTGVDVFFVISGYVITLMLLREWQQRGEIRLGQFYLRRFKRLVPAMAVMVSITLLVSLFFLPPIGEENRVLYTAAGALLFAANIVIDIITGDYFAPNAQSNPLLHTWTLAVEEQFYLVFPLVLIVGLGLWGARRGTIRSAAILVAVLTTGSFALALIGSLFDLPVGESIVGFYSPVARAWEFGVGALLALAASQIGALSTQFRAFLTWSGALAVLLGFFLIDSTVEFPGLWALLPVLGTAGLIAGGMGGSNSAITRVLDTGPMRWIGDLSYSIYLWHWPVIVITHVSFSDTDWARPAAAALSVIPAAASYYFVEQRYRHSPTPTPRSIVFFVAKILWLPALTWIAAWWVATRIVVPFVRDEIGQPNLENVAVQTECITEEGFTTEWAESCTWGSDRSGPPIYLIGDSNAAHFGESVLAAGESLDRPVAILTAPSCVPTSSMRVTYDTGEEVFAWCSDYNAFIYDYLPSATPGTIVIGFSDVLSWSNNRYYRTGDSLTSGSEAKANVLKENLLVDTVQLAQQGHDFVIVKTAPQFRSPGPSWDPRECNLLELVEDRCARTVTIETLDQTQRFNREVLTAVSEFHDAPLVDPRIELCDEKSCSSGDNGFITYRDDIHISVAEAIRLVPYFESALRQTGR